MDLHGELRWRGLLFDETEGAAEALAAGPVTGYIGFDPTAASLHVGSLLPIMALTRLQRFGHSAIALVGGGTGLIGDPKPTLERALLSLEQVEENVRGIHAQLSRFLDFDDARNPALLMNNADWLTKLSAIEFMRDVGKHFSVNAMLAKDAVKRRLESDSGISYTEFSYSLLQAYDYLVLHDRFGCTLQMGGSDQWGNIVAGMDLIRRVRGGKAHGLVLPLVTTASGTKFGKTEQGTVWLDAALTSPYEFYQFWLKVDDRDAIKYLKYFTFETEDTIAEIAHAADREPERRHSQRHLAREVTRIVHGADATTVAEASAALSFSSDTCVESLRQVVDRIRVPRQLFIDGVPVVRVLTLANLVKSNSEGARLIKSGAIALNDVKVVDERLVLTASMSPVSDGVFRLSRGKGQRAVIELVDAD